MQSMNKRALMGLVFIVVFIIIAAAAVWYFSGNSGTAPVTKGTGTNESQGNVAGVGSIVAIDKMKFVPATVNIAVGETVTWRNDDSVNHQIVSDTGDTLSSGAFGNGRMYSFTFNTAGTYEYHCGIHPSMKARVVVG